MQPEFLNLSEASRHLDVHPQVLWRLIKRGELEHRCNPLDRREKLVRADAVDALVVPGRTFAAGSSEEPKAQPVDERRREREAA